MQKRLMQALFVVIVIVLGLLGYDVLGPAPVDELPMEPTATLVSTIPQVANDTPSAAAPEETSPQPPVAPQPAGSAADFDFYVLALSWSPDYCATSGADDPQQCSLGKRLGFVLHGLWPQYDQGYPANCSTQRLPAEVKAQFPNLYPSNKLYAHEWEKHGTCSGLEPEQYLALSKQVKESVRIPDDFRSPPEPFRITSQELKDKFTTANPGFDQAAFATYCSGSGRFLKELYVCFTIQGQPYRCSDEIQKKAEKSCGQPDFLVRNVR